MSELVHTGQRTDRSRVSRPLNSVVHADGDTGLALIFYPIFLSLVFPFFFQLGGLHMSPSRALLLVVTPILFMRLLLGKYGRILPSDFFIVLYVVWLGLSIFVNNRDAFTTFVGSNSVIILGGYLVGRCLVRSPRAFRQLIILMAVSIVVLLPFALIETRTTVRILPDFIDRLPFVSSNYYVNYRPRLGFYRVQQFFAHPIHFGLYCSLAVALVFIGLRQSLNTSARFALTGLVAAACFLSISSGPFLSMLTQLLLIAYALSLHSIKFKWRILFIGFVLIYATLEVLSDRPAYYAIVERLAFAAHTANVRQVLLEYGIAQIGRTPLFGVGYNEWDLPSWMSGSIDNYWLQVALLYGLPAFVGFVGLVSYTMIAIGRRDFSNDPAVRDLKLAFMIALGSLALSLATVSIWNEVATFCFLLIGAGLWMVTYQIPTETNLEEGALPINDPIRTSASRYSRYPQNKARSANSNERV